jgi:membrane protein implicated in regulation of membrane protease activity
VEDWVIWMIAAGALAVGEIVSMGFFLGPVAIAALIGAAVAAAGVGVGGQLAVFVVATVASLAVLRPVARRHLITPPRIRTGTAALQGESAVVLEPVDRDGGQVKLGGEVWSARAFVEGEAFAEGARVRVVRIVGATALVDEE